MTLKNKWYQAKIMERFLTKEEQIKFEEKYEENKIVTLGQKQVKVGNNEILK